MASTTDRKRSAATASGAALAAVMLTTPALAAQGVAAPMVDQASPAPAPAPAATRTTGYEKHLSENGVRGFIKLQSVFKHKDVYSVAGMGGGHVVFEDARGQLFYVDDATGDQKFVSRSYYLKLHSDQARSKTQWKWTGPVSIVGLDQDGKTIMSNARGENFYLDAATGDMIFVKK